MNRGRNQTGVVDIYAFLEMPVSRSPKSFGNRASVQALPAIVQDGGNFTNAPEIGAITHDESAPYGQVGVAAVNIPPMLHP